MYSVSVKYKSPVSGVVDTLTGIFTTYRECYQYVDEFPNKLCWSISPIKVLNPIAESKQVYRYSIIIEFRDGTKDVIKDISIKDISSEILDNLDYTKVSQVRIKFFE